MNGPALNPPLLAACPPGMAAIRTYRYADPVARQRCTTAIGIGASVLLHILLLTLTMHYRIDPVPPLASGSQEPITVRLAPRIAEEAVPETPAPPPQPAPRAERPREKPIALPKTRRRPSLQVPPEPESKPVREPEPQIDMTAMIDAARARRQQAEATAARENADAAAVSRPPSADDLAMANIQRSLQGKREGTGGVFQVVHKGVRTGTFIFRGWTPGARNATQQTIEVDAGPNGDVERAIVRRMIELIRTHYSGDFNWESHRLGRVLVKSARVEDQAELEAFLMREFFGG